MYIKICCIQNPKEAQMAIAAGATALGLVGPMPSGPGTISLDQIKSITKNIPANIKTFLLSSETTVENLVKQIQFTACNTLQIVDQLNGSYQKLREYLPNTDIVQVLHVLDESSIEEAHTLYGKVDYILLDSGNPNAKVKELGGTGRVHNWEISKELVKQSKTPVYLAGGLKPTNIADAIKTVSPYGVDLCSGVRTDGVLDEKKLITFIQNLRLP